VDVLYSTLYEVIDAQPDSISLNSGSTISIIEGLVFIPLDGVEDGLCGAPCTLAPCVLVDPTA
jgi:hypothetical protein